MVTVLRRIETSISSGLTPGSSTSIIILSNVESISTTGAWLIADSLCSPIFSVYSYRYRNIMPISLETGRSMTSFLGIFAIVENGIY